MKNIVKIGHWDTTQGAPTPRIVGQISGTPTIKLIKPALKKNKSNKKKIVLDYQYERKMKDMKNFVSSNINNFVERIEGSKGKHGLDKFLAKASKYGLPVAIVFTKSSTTKPLVKYASSEFRRRLLIGEVRMTKPNKVIIEQYKIKEGETNLVVINRNKNGDLSEPVVYPTSKGFKFHKVINFLSSHALSKPVNGAKKKASEEDAPSKKKEL